MTLRRGGLRTAAVALAWAMASTLSACSQSSHADAVGADGTALPSATPRAPDAGVVLDRRVRALLAVPAVSVDEDLQTGDAEVEVRLAWSMHGSVVDATSLPLTAGSGPGYEVFRSPDTLLQRPAGTGDPCWSPGGDEAARFDQRVVQEIAVLRSAHAVSGDHDLLRGSVSARALLGVLGSPSQLQALGLDAPAGVRVPATFGTTGDALAITTGWGALAEAAGSSKKASGTLLLRFRPFGTTGPSAPRADMMCS